MSILDDCVEELKHRPWQTAVELATATGYLTGSVAAVLCVDCTKPTARVTRKENYKGTWAYRALELE